MTKYQLITQAYQTTIGQVTEFPVNWMRFMRSACRNYKCRFDEQVLIYAQRPDATAVLEIEKWNKQFGRWVNKGATGIAVFDDEHNGNYLLKHYFDIADTHESRFSRPVPLWQMEQQYEAEVIEHLENSFGELEDTSTFAAALISAAKNAVDDNITDYLHELMQTREDSYLEELDDLNVEVEYQTVLRNSVAYMLLTRCGIDGESCFDFENFQHIIDFNTPQTVNALGMATSDIAESCLREISATVISLQKQEKNQNRTFAKTPQPGDNIIKNSERSIEHGTDISDGGRLQSTQPDRAGGKSSSPWQVRITPKEISQTEPEDNVRKSADIGQAERALDGDRADSQREDGTVGRADGGAGGRERGTQSDQSDEMGGLDELDTAISGGTDTPRPDLRIKPLPPQHYQLTLLGEAEELKPSAFSISQQIIDEVLTSGGNEENSVHRIISYFKKDHNTADNAAFLQKEYGDGGKGFIFNKNRVSIWFNDSGIRIAVGDTALNTSNADLITWEQAVKRIRELLDIGRYAPQSELDKADGLVLSELCSKLYFIYRDGVGTLPEEWTEKSTMFHDCVPIIAEQLCNPETLQLVINKLDADWQIAQSGALPDDFKWVNYLHWHVPDTLRGLHDLQRESLVFTAVESVSTARPGFITQDEVDAILIGGGDVVDSKFRIYSFFLQGHSAKEKTDFLKDEYGWGGGTKTGGMEMHDGKGISFSRENNHMPYDKVLLPWNKVAKRIDELIADGKYMSQRELEYIPEYEKGVLSREINSFYAYQPEEVPRPFPSETEYSKAAEIIRPQLDEPERVAEILMQMAAILDNTADFDRNYENMQKTFDDLTAYQNGTFSLFTPVKPAEKEIELTFPALTLPEPPAPPADETVMYDLQLGVTVFIGTDEYEVYSFDDTHVVLRDLNAPLFTKDMPRDEFDRKLRENRLNDGLIKVDTDTSKPQQEPEIDENTELKDQIRDRLDWLGYMVSDELIEDGLAEYDNRGGDGDYKDIADFIERVFLSEEETPELPEGQPCIPKVGDHYEIDGRRFIVDTVDTEYDKVSLRDVTFENGVGFPIFRSETLDFMELYEPIQPEPPTTAIEEPAEKETGQEPRFVVRHTSYVDVISSNPRRVAIADKAHTYGIWDNESEHYLKNQDESHVVFDTEEEAAEYANKLNNDGIPIPPAWEQTKRRSRTQTFDIHPEIPMSDRHNYCITDDDLGHGGAKTKFRYNIEAIKTLQNVELENRFATPEEQEILSRYVGWGGLQQAFDPDNTSWTNEYLELNALLSPEDYNSARATTLNAHYTSPTVIKAIYKAIENMGFKTGNVLEPSCGIGNFMGLMPESMSDSKMFGSGKTQFFGIELDSVTGRIAQQLYQYI